MILWEARFKSIIVEGHWNSLLKVAAYIDLNSVRAGMVDDPKDYRWSGYSEAVAGDRAARKDGARRMKGGDWGEMVTARALQVKPISNS